MKSIRDSIGRLFIISGLVALVSLVHAQETATPGQGGTVSLDATNIDWNSLSDFEVELQAVEATTPVAAESLPQSGTFYSAAHMAEGWPPLPGNIYNVSGWPLDTNLVLLNDFAVSSARSAKQAKTAGKMIAMDDPPSPGDDGGGGTNSYLPGYMTPIDYGTNLWIAKFTVTSNNAVGTLSNSLADVMYEIQYKNNLATDTQWLSGGFVLGSELTNWTALVMANVSRTNNAFFRVRSWQDDGSGLPIWWQMQYFGHTGLDPFSFDPSGDGFTLWQAFTEGLNPTNFNTPAAPQGLTASYNANNTATVSWQLSPGPVTGYTIQRDYYSFTVSPYDQSQTFNVSAGTTSLQDTTPFTNPYYVAGDGLTVRVSYKIQAHYAGGDSAWSDVVWLEPSSSDISLVAGPQGSAYFAARNLPAGTTALRLMRLDEYLESQNGDSPANIVSFDIPLSTGTNGLYPIPAEAAASPPDAYGKANYQWFAQPINANGQGTSQEIGLGYGFYSQLSPQTWIVSPYFDGRAQLKQNLIFLLRAATVDFPFYYQDIGGAYQETVTNSAAYAYSAFNSPYPIGGWDIQSLFDVFSPFQNNYLYRNFVFSLADVGTDGHISTGVSGNYAIPYENGLVLLDPPLGYRFQPPTTNGTAIGALLATNQTQWLCSYPLDSPEMYYDPGTDSIVSEGNLEEIGVTPSYDAGFNQWETMAANARNVYGLPFVSAKIAWGNTSGATYTLSAGTQVESVDGYFYPQTAQPQFQTVEYDFWNPKQPGENSMYWIRDSLPGGPNFSTANTSDVLIAGVANPNFQVAGYAKLAIQNGYGGVYGYLGQYFDTAYQIDTNGNVTTNPTGVLSSYGGFFATEPGPAALVTMPDVDTGARGTCTVYCVSLNLDANHDGNMDLSFNGPDATSQARPMEWWINNDYDFTSGSADPFGHDIENDFRGNYQDPAIACPRDLEDFARLWICGLPPLPASQGYSVTLSMSAMSGSPAINLVNAFETNGGTLYLTDTNTALAQCVDYMGDGPGQKYRTITTTSALTLPANLFTNAGNKFFLFEGAGIGEGQLTLTIADNGGNTIAKTSAYLDIHDIKDFYEQAVITNNTSSSISNWTSGIESVQQAASSALGNDTNLIVFVHGFNVGGWDWMTDSETVFKRLYWAGYHGQFASVKWPCEPITAWTFISVDTSIFNNSEIKSYKAATALKNYLSQLRTRFSNCQLNIFAHSQGNAVMGEAIEQGAPFDNYILTQGAMPASSYDVNAPTDSTLLAADIVYGTPEWQPMGYHAVYTNMTGRIVSFFNPNDSVLGIWKLDQAAGKPDGYAKNLLAASPYYTYDGVNGWHHSLFNIFTYLVTDPQESRAMISRSRTGPVGRQTTSGVINSTVDLSVQFGFTTGTDEHSAEWTRPIQTSRPYYVQLLNSIAP